MSVDVVTKFTYLEHGKVAPKHSSFKGNISTKSLLGFTNYGKRLESRELSVEAKSIANDNKNFFDYTNTRLGSTKTYSSIGWIDNPQKDMKLRNDISNSFNKDGDIVWVPVISLKDFMTSAEMKLFNEEDYAAVIDKVLPMWFEKSGFKNDNMMWWMDHHVNTDNPHIHLCFLEKEKTVLNGKLPMKNINNFKNLFWREVFSKSRYLEATGKTVEEGFKNKDLLKQETYKTFKENMKKCTDQEFVKQMKDLYNRLPANGRLQYNSSHMIPYRSDVNKIVDYLLRTPGVDEQYEKFTKCITEFDEIRSKSLGTKGVIKKAEDSKLRVMLANVILSEYKNINHEFWKNQLDVSIKKMNRGELQSETEVPDDTTIILNQDDDSLKKTNKKPNNIEFTKIPIAAKLILNQDDNQFLVRLPCKGDCIYIDKSNCISISQEKQFYVATIYDTDTFEVFDKKGNGLDDTLDINTIHNYFDDGQPYLDSVLKMESDKNMRVELWNQRMMEWSDCNHNWYKSVRGIKNASFSWMNEIEREVSQARNEFLDGKEYLI